MSMAKTKRVILLLSRLLAFSATLSAAIIMASSHQKTIFFSLSFEAKFTHTPSFKYYLIVNIIISVYGLLALLLPPGSAIWRLVICTDTIAAVLLSSCVSAAMAVAEVGKNGNSYAGWLPIRGQVSKYCDQVTAALVAGFVALIIYFLFLLYAFHNLLCPLLLQKT